MNNPAFFLKEAEINEQKADLEQAMAYLDQGLSLYPQNEAMLLKKAFILMDDFEDIDEAFRILLSVEKSFGDQSIEQLKKRLDEELLLELYLLLTDCFRLKENYREAFSHALMAQKISPKAPAAILAVATAHFELGSYEKAKDMLRSFQEDPTAECFWLLGQILCAEGLFSEADEMFSCAAEDSAYHEPVRIGADEFVDHFNGALLSLPEEIALAVNKHAVQILDIVPHDEVLNSAGKLSPRTSIRLEAGKLIYLYQKNIENLIDRDSELSETIASVLLHGLMPTLRSKIS